MLVYKTTDSNETKFYGVVNNDYFANEVINDYKNAENAGFIDYEHLNGDDIKKLIDLTVENINTMRQAFEVYSILNNQSLKDTREDFRHVTELYCDDGKPESFYRVATLDEFKEVMFDNVNLGYWEINNLLEWLENNLEDFRYTVVHDFGKDEECEFYKFNDYDNNAYLTLNEDILMTVYGGAVDIVGLEKDEQGHPLTDSNGTFLEMVPELYADERDYDNEYVDEYMREHYNAIPAEKEVTYY